MDVYHIVGDKSLDDHVAVIREALEKSYDAVSLETKKYQNTDRYILTATTTSNDKNALAVYYIYGKDGGLFTVRIS